MDRHRAAGPTSANPPSSTASPARRRSIVGDEPGITRDRIYGEVSWQGRTARVIDTGGIVPDDQALIPAEIFRQARVRARRSRRHHHGRRWPHRAGLARPRPRPPAPAHRQAALLAVNKIDTKAWKPLRREVSAAWASAIVIAISAEHGNNIGELLDDVFAA
jgi:GTPase